MYDRKNEDEDARQARSFCLNKLKSSVIHLKYGD